MLCWLGRGGTVSTEFANEIRRKQAGEITHDALLTSKAAMNSSMHSSSQIRRKWSGRNSTTTAMAAVAEAVSSHPSLGSVTEEGDDEEPVVQVDEDTVMQDIPSPIPKRALSPPPPPPLPPTSKPRSPMPASRPRSSAKVSAVHKAAVAPTAMDFPRTT